MKPSDKDHASHDLSSDDEVSNCKVDLDPSLSIIEEEKPKAGNETKPVQEKHSLEFIPLDSPDDKSDSSQLNATYESIDINKIFSKGDTTFFQDITNSPSLKTILISKTEDKLNIFKSVENKKIEFILSVFQYFSEQDQYEIFKYSIQTSNIEVFEALIANPMKDKQKDHNGKPFIHFAYETGSSNIFELLVTKYNMINVKDKNSETIMFTAIRDHNVEGIKFLLNHGGNITNINNQFKTPFQYAVELKESKIAILIINSVNLETFNNEYIRNAIVTCIEQRKMDIIKAFHDVNFKSLAFRALNFPLLCQFLIENDDNNAELLIDLAMTIDTPMMDGTTPLILAASKGKLEFCKKLIDLRVDLNVENKYGNAYINAIVNEFNELASFLYPFYSDKKSVAKFLVTCAIQKDLTNFGKFFNAESFGRTISTKCMYPFKEQLWSEWRKCKDNRFICALISKYGFENDNANEDAEFKKYSETEIQQMNEVLYLKDYSVFYRYVTEKPVYSNDKPISEQIPKFEDVNEENSSTVSDNGESSPFIFDDEESSSFISDDEEKPRRRHRKPLFLDKYQDESTMPEIYLNHKCYVAIKKGDIPKALDLIKLGAYKNTKDFEKDDIFKYAVKHFELQDFCKMLIDNGMTQIVYNSSKTCVMLCAIHDCYDLLAYLISKNYDVHTKEESSNRTALHYASMHGFGKITSTLCDLSDTIEERDFNGNTPLFLAVLNSKLESLKVLIEKSANVNCKNNKNLTPIIVAGLNGNIEMCQYLYNNGASLNELYTFINENPEVYTANELFNFSRTIEQFSFSEISSLTPSVLLQMFENATDDHAKKFIRDNDKNIMHYAIKLQNPKLLLKLLKFGADPFITDEDGNNVLMKACQSTKFNEFIQEVLNKDDSKIDDQNKEGMTALHFATISGKREIVDLLLKHSANVSLLGKHQYTPLMFACEAGDKQIVKMLILRMRKEEINLTNVYHETALFLACLTDNPMIVIHLIENGADVEIANENGVTPFMISCTSSSKFLYGYLRRVADIYRKDNMGNTALNYASYGKNKKIIKSLKKRIGFMNHKEVLQLSKLYGFEFEDARRGLRFFNPPFRKKILYTFEI
ncbi:hypothetical protein TVAG_417110 [Trichomonas vaginalis G3]|uniref:Ankyrin repeat protein n=1 Tax=Trichomonas vaginalis (strain ATCC PRA-98 / G3) TaxID=412133 RepID=A2ESG9_TRIV3|nr:spectrin binding [Trichomonas vaginalis G3]EAY04413.1 hypothetical protein TVAG_417110 [Trichomonas vaginalis G3]KAI5526330.1 spectrin binding [Trichomonas vaginalis G3]|eukprot:XP_001316636.1 hypothetical protein [Trichomonas vaginalis G3]